MTEATGKRTAKVKLPSDEEILVRHTDKRNHDGHLNGGMEAGMNETLDLLEQVALA